MNASEMQELYFSRRAKTLLHHPQGMGNYFTFKSAIDILGLNWDDLLPNGVYNVTGNGYYDMGYMANHIEPPESAIQAFKEHATSKEMRVYPLDCIPEMKAYVAEHKFGRKLGDDFTVMGVEARRVASAIRI